MNALAEYKACTILRVNGGRTNISCKLGLWSVNSLCHSTAQRNAQNYFKQYKSDGEYFDIIGGKTTGDILLELHK